MKRVLLLHYHFLPVHNVGVKHLLGHARHLRAHGWAPTVLTKAWQEIRPLDAAWGLSWEPEIESSLGDRVSIHRVPERLRPAPRLPQHDDPMWLRRARALRHLAAGDFPDPFVGWIAPAVKAGIALHRRSAFDAILSYCPPETNVLVGSRLARRLGVPWIVYFGDLYHFHLPSRPSKLSTRVQALMHRSWMRPATACAAVSPAMTRYVQHTYGVPTERIVVGFDEDEFVQAPPARERDRMVISHIGSIYPAVQRPEILFAGLDAFCAAHPGAAKHVVVRLVGTKCDDTLRAMLKGRPAEAMCEILPKAGSARAVDLVRASDVLLAFTVIRPDDAGTFSYPSKIFEAFAARRPVLLIPADGDWVDQLLRDTAGGESADTAADVAGTLGRWYQAWMSTGSVPSSARPDVVAAFSHAAQAARLAGVLDRAVETRG